MADGSTGLRSRTVRAIAWTSVSSLLTQVLTFSSALVLIRLISPSDFGTMAIAIAVIGLAVVVADTGLSTALVQRADCTRAASSSVFWVQLTVSVAMTALTVSLAGPLAALFHSPAVQPILVALAVTLPMQGLSAVPRALVVRELRMGHIATVDILAALSSAVIGVVAALLHQGVWALVYAAQAWAGVSVLGAVLAARWLPAWTINRTDLRELASFARPFYGTVLITYLIRNGDNMLIGRFLGSYQLGLYSRAYALLLVPSRQITGVVGSTLQISLARIAKDLERSRRVYLETCRHILFLTMPLMLFLAVIAEDFVPVVMGERWLPAIPTIRVLALVGILEPLAGTCGWLYYAQGRTDLGFRMSLIAGPVYLGAIGLGVYAGSATSAAMAYLLINIVMIPLLLARAGSLIGVRLRDHVRSARSIALASALTGLAVAGLQHLLASAGVAPALRLLAECVAGASSYLLFARLLKVEEAAMLFDLRTKVAASFRARSAA